jgi:hypothetical protein
MRYETLIFIAFLLILLGGCTGQVIQERQYENLNSNKLMVIALEEGCGSQFKDALVDSLVARYRDRYDIEVVKVRTEKSIADRNYDILVVMDKVKAAGMLNNNLKSILKWADPAKTVVFVSHNGGNVKLKGQVDLVTAATKKNPVRPYFLKLAEKIDAKIR